jgi:hypothetical protein
MPARALRCEGRRRATLNDTGSSAATGNSRPTDTYRLRLVARYLPFADHRYRIDIAFDKGGFIGMLRVQIVLIWGDKVPA